MCTISSVKSSLNGWSRANKKLILSEAAPGISRMPHYHKCCNKQFFNTPNYAWKWTLIHMSGGVMCMSVMKLHSSCVRSSARAQLQPACELKINMFTLRQFVHSTGKKSSLLSQLSKIIKIHDSKKRDIPKNHVSAKNFCAPFVSNCPESSWLRECENFFRFSVPNEKMKWKFTAILTQHTTTDRMTR